MHSPTGSFLKETSDGKLLLKIKVVPRASRTEIADIQGDELKVRVMAPPVDSAANQALVRFLADTLGCAKSQILVLKGEASRHKTLLVTGVKHADLLSKLGAG